MRQDPSTPREAGRRAIRLAVLALAAAGAIGPVSSAPPMGDDWPQFRGPRRDGTWKETGLLEKLPQPELPIRWRAPVAQGFSGPTVADGRVYVMDRVTEPIERERVHCFAWDTGRKLWSFEYTSLQSAISYKGPRASVTLEGGRAYSIGAVGHAHCFDAATGRVIWKRDLGTEYRIRMPDWGIAASPLVDGDLVILQIGGSDGACLVALEKATGRERWRALADRASYSSPVLTTQAGKRVLLCWTAERLAGLDPQTGKSYWEVPHPSNRMPDQVISPVVDGDRVFISSWYEGALLVKLQQDRPAVQEVWRRLGQNERNTDAFHALMSGPFFQGDHLYGVDTYGELRCLDARTGARVWESLAAGPRVRSAAIHMVRNAGRVWMFNQLGQLLIARLSPAGFEELSRSQLIQPTRGESGERNGVCWSHPAYAYRHVFARNDQEVVCADLSAR